MKDLTTEVFTRAYMATSLRLHDPRVRERLTSRERFMAEFILDHSLGCGMLSLPMPARPRWDWLARQTGISKGNVSVIMQSLVELGMVLVHCRPEAKESKPGIEEVRIQLDVNFWRVPVRSLGELLSIRKELKELAGAAQCELLPLEQSLAEGVSDLALRSARWTAEAQTGAPVAGLRGAGAPDIGALADGQQGEALSPRGRSQIGYMFPENIGNGAESVPNLGTGKLECSQIGYAPKALASASNNFLKLKAKASLSVQEVNVIEDALWEVIARELTAQPQYERQWRALVQENPVYVRHLLEKLKVAKREESVARPAAWMSRIARDDQQWPM